MRRSERSRWPESAGAGKRYDKITCVEMAEHVGIKNFQSFLLQVKSMLEDDGVFYLQIAGLRRAWQYEDLVWELFMGKYVFPAADASCPLGFVVSQAERAGSRCTASRIAARTTP
jgi:sphingolipid C9-methyltransferase